MKLSDVNLSKNLLVHLTKTLFFLLFVLFATAAGIRAQGNINDDLPQPAKPTVKPASRQKINKPAAKPRQSVRRPVARPIYNAPYSAPRVVVPPAAPVQTPSEILARFMNYQQSASVTGRDWESVVKQTSAILQTSADDKTAKAQLAVAQGELAFNRGDYSNALIQFNAAAIALPDSALPFYGIGRVYLNTKQANRAENAFERSVKIDKNFALGYKGLGDAMTAQGKTKKADDYYKQAARVSGSPTGSAANNSGNNANASNGGNAPAAASEPSYDRDLKIAREYTARKKWQMALNKLEPLAASNPSAEMYIAIGDNYYGMESWLSAQQAYRKAVEFNPNLAVAHYKSGMVLYEMNEFQAAGESFEKSLILDQSGATINRSQARKMADKAKEKVRDMNKKVK